MAAPGPMCARRRRGPILWGSRERETDPERLDRLVRLLACRGATDRERAAGLGLLDRMRGRYVESEADAIALLSYGDAPRDETLPAAEVAAWTLVAVTFLASDLALLLY